MKLECVEKKRGFRLHCLFIMDKRYVFPDQSHTAGTFFIHISLCIEH